MKSNMDILDPTGHSSIEWDADNEDEVVAAQAHFDTLRKKKYLAFKVDKDGDPGEQISKFDPELEHIVMSPPMVGG